MITPRELIDCVRAMTPEERMELTRIWMGPCQNPTSPEQLRDHFGSLCGIVPAPPVYTPKWNDAAVKGPTH